MMLNSLVDRLTLIQGQFKIEAATTYVSGLQGNGVSSVARVSDGLYDITLQDSYNKLLDFHAVPVAASAGTASNVAAFALDSEPSLADSSPVIRIQALAGADGAKVVPTTGTVIKFSILLRNSATKGKGE